MINLQLKCSSILTRMITDEFADKLQSKLDAFISSNPDCIIRGIHFFDRPTGQSYYRCLIIYTK